MANKENLDITIVNSITLAHILGITDRRVRQLVEEKVLEPVSRGKYELIKTVQTYCTYLRQKAEVNDNKMSSQSAYESERALHEKAKREKAEIELAIMKNELHDAVDVERVMTNMLTILRTRLLSIPEEIAEDLIRAETEADAEEILMEHIKLALIELSDYDASMFVESEEIEAEDNRPVQQSTEEPKASSGTNR